MQSTTKQPKKSAVGPKLSDKHRRVFAEVVAIFGSRPFRRSDVANHMYPLTTPRSRERANAFAEAAMREAAGLGKIRRHGHLHWVRVNHTRRLLDGTPVAELDEPVSLTLNTKCPDKWAAVDLETGHVWMSRNGQWTKASRDVAAMVAGAPGAKPRAEGEGVLSAVG